MARKFIIVEQSATSIGGHYFAYTANIAHAAAKTGLDVAVLSNKRLTVDAETTPFTVRPTFTHTWGESETLGARDFGTGQFAFELDGELRALQAGHGDLVFIHTCAYAELRETLDYLCALPPETRYPTFHILLRYDPEHLINCFSDFAGAFQFIAQSAFLRSIVYFHSDTEGLAEVFGRITGRPFGVCPIPCDQSMLATVAAQPAKARGDGSITVTYLGDARIEKGYAHIPDAVAHIQKHFSHQDRVRYVLQSNFNVENGEAGMQEAVTRLEALGSSVTLLKTPLGPETYMQVLAASDIIILPYSAERYRYRSSGILVEALTAGKVIVTTRGSWMETQVSADHAVLIEHESLLGAGLLEALNNFAALKKSAEAKAAGWKLSSTPEAMMRYLLAASPQPATETAPTLLVVMDGGAIVLDNGASRVFETQMRYLEMAGYRICGVFLSHDSKPPSDGWKRALLRRLHAHRFERIFLAGLGPYQGDVARDAHIQEESRNGQYSIANDIRRVSAYHVTGEACRYFRHSTPDAVLLNYVTNFPILDNLGLSHLPVICEMHDIQALQKAIYGRREVSDVDISAEIELLRRCTALIALNAHEAQFVKARLPGHDVAVGGIVYPNHQLQRNSLAGARDCVDIVASTRPNHAALQYSPLRRTIEGNEVRKLAGFGDAIDLLFVSSAHFSNLSGLNWFLNEVYAPYLDKMGVSLVIAGSIEKLGPFPAFEKVVFVGQVANLDPLYTAARIVALPITEGAGSAVKAYEAISRQKPVVATPFALRGFEADCSALQPTDDPKAFADRILALLASREMRNDAVKASARLADDLGTFPRYARIMDDALAKALGARARRAAVAEEQAVGPRAVVEWDGEFRQFSEALRAIIGNHPVSTAIDLADHGKFGEAQLREMVAALFSGQAFLADADIPGLNASIIRARECLKADDIIAIIKGITGAQETGTRAIVVNARIPGLTRISGEIDGSANLVLLGGDAPATGSRAFQSAWKGQGPEFGVLHVSSQAKGEIVQDIPLQPHLGVLNHPVFYKWRFTTGEDGRAQASIEHQHLKPTKPSIFAKFDQLMGNRRLARLRDQAFDAGWYLNQYPDIAAARINPLHHYLRHGTTEGRHPNAWFDTFWYRERYADVAKSGLNPLDHYLSLGATLGYDPSVRFSTRGYTDNYPDVWRAGVNPLIHFLQHGVTEGRNPLLRAMGCPPQSLFLPMIGGMQDANWVELTLKTPFEDKVPIQVFEQGVELHPDPYTSGASHVVRYQLAPLAKGQEFGLRCLSVTSRTGREKKGPLLLTTLRLGITL